MVSWEFTSVSQHVNQAFFIVRPVCRPSLFESPAQLLLTLNDYITDSQKVKNLNWLTAYISYTLSYLHYSRVMIKIDEKMFLEKLYFSKIQIQISILSFVYFFTVLGTTENWVELRDWEMRIVFTCAPTENSVLN